MKHRAENTKMKNISCQVTQDFFETVNSAAHKLKMSKSEFMRSAISNKIKCMKKNGELF